MRGQVERDAVEIAREELRASARRYAAAYLTSWVSSECDLAEGRLQMAAVALVNAERDAKQKTARARRAT